MIERKAIFSPDRDRIYRYTLWRDWSAQLKDGDFFTPDPHFDYYPGTRDTFVQFIGLNPSKADEIQDDNTISRLIKWAQTWGFGALCMTNLFAYRSTDRKKMLNFRAPIGVDNDRWIYEIAQHAGLVVCCWGRDGQVRGHGIAAALRAMKIKLHVFRLLDGGVPEHPLYLPKTLAPKVWEA